MARKTIHWLHGEIKTPPLSIEARREFGFLLRMVQEGEPLSMPHSRPMPGIGSGCHELRERIPAENGGSFTPWWAEKSQFWISSKRRHPPPRIES